MHLIVTGLKKLLKLFMFPAILIFSATSADGGNSNGDGSSKQSSNELSETPPNASSGATNAQATPSTAAGNGTKSYQNEKTYAHRLETPVKSCLYRFKEATAIQLDLGKISFGLSLNNELPRTNVGRDIADSFHIMINDGQETKNVCHTEIEAHTSRSDMIRFKIDDLAFFDVHADDGFEVTKTIIITREITKDALAVANNPNVYRYKPQIYDTSEHSARKTFDRVRKAIDEGGEINEFDLILTPMYTDSRKPIEVLNEACDLVLASGKDTEWQEDVLKPLLVIGNNYVSAKDFDSVLRRVRKMNFNFQEVIVNNAIEVNKQEIAANFIKDGLKDYAMIARNSGLSLQQVMEIKDEVEAELNAAAEEAAAKAKTVATKKRAKKANSKKA